MDKLWVENRFRTHPGEDRCDAVDGLGWLFLALLKRHVPGSRVNFGLFF
jgi:hypothetical protein